MAMVEIDKSEEGRHLSELEKNRLAMKFIEMNMTPEKYDYFKRFTDEHIKKVRLNLKLSDLRKF